MLFFGWLNFSNRDRGDSWTKLIQDLDFFKTETLDQFSDQTGQNLWVMPSWVNFVAMHGAEDLFS